MDDLFHHGEAGIEAMDPAEDPALEAAELAPHEAPAAIAGPPGVDLALIARLYASDSVGRFLSRRVDQAIRHGHTPEADLEASCYMLANAMRGRFAAVLERLEGRPDAERLKTTLNTIDNLGGMLMALRDRVAAELAKASCHPVSPAQREALP